MLDRTRTPDISDLGYLCRRYLDIAEIFDEYACNCDMPKDDDHRQTAERLCSAVRAMTDMLRELSAVASVLDGWAMPEDYGFPPEPIQAPHTASYNAGYADGMKAAQDQRSSAGYTLEDGTPLSEFARSLQNLTAEQLDNLTGEKENDAAERLLKRAERSEVIAEILEKLRLLGLVTDQPTPDSREDGVQQ